MNHSSLIRRSLLRAARRWRDAPADLADRADIKLCELALWCDGHVDLQTLGAVPAAIHAFVHCEPSERKADLNLRRTVDELFDECLEYRRCA